LSKIAIGIVVGDRMLEQLRLSEVRQDDPAHAAMMRPARSAVPRLLVIDDDNLHRMIICRVAVRAGYLPAGAASYDEAVELVRQGAFDCITLDLSLGDHAGVELLRHLWVIGCKVPVIIVSGCDDATCGETEKVAESLKVNVWESIPKPVDLAVLRDSLERLKTEREEANQISPA
jgi:two-component system, chemotaxis family, chemotaxis protein CheY